MTRSIAAGKGHVEIGIRNRIAAGARGVQSDLDKMGNALRGQGARLAAVGGTIAAAAVGPLALAVLWKVGRFCLGWMLSRKSAPAVETQSIEFPALESDYSKIFADHIEASGQNRVALAAELSALSARPSQSSWVSSASQISSAPGLIPPSSLSQSVPSVE